MKKFNNEFKTNAVRLVREEGLKIGDVASDLGIGTSTLKMWLSKHDQGQLQKTDKQAREEEEIKRLKKENRILRQEREILKRPWAFSPRCQKQIQSYEEVEQSVSHGENVPSFWGDKKRILLLLVIP